MRKKTPDFTPEEIESMREEYINSRVVDFCAKYWIWPKRAVDTFWPKFNQVVTWTKEKRKEYNARYRADRKQWVIKKRVEKIAPDIKEIMEKFWVEKGVVLQALETYTKTEIMKTWYVEKGILKAKDIIKIFR